MMTSTPEIRGIPRALARDAWWFGDDAAAPPDGRERGGHVLSPGAMRPVLVLVLLIVIGDFLFWDRAAGISLVVFAWVVLLASAALWSRKRIAGPLTLMLFSSLPVVEYLQALSVAILLLGLTASVAWMHLPPDAPQGAVARVSARILRSLPTRAIRDLLRYRPDNRFLASALDFRGFVRAWALPIGGALILISLLAEANPILGEWLLRVLTFQPDWAEVVPRSLFWTGLAMATWPYLLVPETDPGPAADPRQPRSWAWLGLNPSSALRALVVFNLLVGVQTFLDIVVLVGGGGLPEGMTYSDYARQGSYPLLLITLLGGSFALATRPFLDERRWLRPYLYLWLLQNILICVGALQRLVLYVDAYGLTYLRLHTMIWIPLVATGLALTAWQVHRKHPNSWLLLRSVVLAAGVLYGAGFVNFADIIARHNMSHEARIDWVYLLVDLPGTALPSIRERALALGCPETVCEAAAYVHRDISDWRAWGFRRFRVDLRMQALDDLEDEK
jgi:hypothetical protein